MEEALALVSDAVTRAAAMKLDSTINISLQRAIGDNQVTFAVQVPPGGRVERPPPPPQPQPSSQPTPRLSKVNFEPNFAPPELTAGITSPGPESRFGGQSSALRPRSNTEIDFLNLKGAFREPGSERPAEAEVVRLMQEIERLKRKALSRGVNLASQHEDVPAEDVTRLRAVFSMADATGAGFIDQEELQALHKALGEPITDEEAEDAFRRIDVNRSGAITFDDFLSWYTLAHSRSGILSKKGQAYSQRFKKLMAQIEGAFDLKNLSVSTSGEPGTLAFRLNFHYNDLGVLKPISPWHDIPLYSSDGHCHFICEIPKWTRKKYEIATGEEFNPIKQDTKNGKLREYTYGDMLFNYGAFPQTWEDPSHATDVEEPQLHRGDNDPIDGVEIGTAQLRSGSVTKVKVLGMLAMIDDGETDWKVFCISVDDPLAPQIDHLDDLERVLPSAVSTVREWFRVYKTSDGKPENKFGFGGKALSRQFALETIDETHKFWQQLTLTGKKTV